jgi:hypothetical protein
MRRNNHPTLNLSLISNLWEPTQVKAADPELTPLSDRTPRASSIRSRENSPITAVWAPDHLLLHARLKKGTAAKVRTILAKRQAIAIRISPIKGSRVHPIMLAKEVLYFVKNVALITPDSPIKNLLSSPLRTPCKLYIAAAARERMWREEISEE